MTTDSFNSLKKIASQYDFFNVINLNYVQANYTLLKDKHVDGLCSAVIKANAYGLGIRQIASILYIAGCRDFFVSDIHEAMQTRELFPKCNIYILNSLISDSLSLFEHYNFIPVLGDFSTLELWSKYNKRYNKNLAAIIQFDTGMHRGGLNKNETKNLFSNSDILNFISIKYFMSHLSCAEENNHPLNHQQNTNFKKIINSYRNVPATLANSGGVFLGKDYYYQLLRPGAAIYGISPTPYEENPMQEVLTSYAKILQLQDIKKGSSVSYCASYVAKNDMKAAIISAGYFNGYPWSSSNIGWVYIGKWQAPIIGRISMNTLVVDVTKIPNAFLYPGAFVELVGLHITLDKVAKWGKSISREILVRLASGGKNFYKIGNSFIN